MLRLSECIFVSNIEFVVIYIVQEHIDAAEVVCCNVDLLPEKALTHLVFSKNFGGFQQQRTRTTGRIYCRTESDTI